MTSGGHDRETGDTGPMLVLGHRGAPRAAPENTPAAFERADEMGADGVELDVRLAPGGRLVVHHDMLPSAPDLVAALPSLADVLDACGARMLVNVEIKNGADEPGFDPSLAVVGATIAELVGRGPVSAHRWLISSFSWATIERSRREAPSIPTAHLVVEATDELCARAADAGHAAIHPWANSLTADVVRRCHAAGLAVNTWTCNDADRLAELAAMGVDGVCTDVPDAALAALGRGGRAPAVSPRWGTRG